MDNKNLKKQTYHQIDIHVKHIYRLLILQIMKLIISPCARRGLSPSIILFLVQYLVSCLGMTKKVWHQNTKFGVISTPNLVSWLEFSEPNKKNDPIHLQTNINFFCQNIKPRAKRIDPSIKCFEAFFLIFQQVGNL